jgi:cytidylate kinase
VTGAPVDAAAAVLELALAGPPRLGRTRLVCVDGPAGSGKTTFADALVAAARQRAVSVALVHLDDVYAGWDGLPDVGRRVREQVVLPLAEGRPASYERYDWHEERFADQVPVPQADLLVVEGVGSADPSYGDQVAVLVWVWAPAPLRRQRWQEREGPAAEAHRRRWVADEEQLHDRHRTADRADVVVDGRSGRLSRGSGAGA